MNNHTELLNYLATTFNLQSYLEIGVSIPENNFDKIVCKKYKVGVDPNVDAPRIFKGTSDEFFDEINDGEKWDLIFIDGNHTKEQAKKDFENSLRCLNDNGFIVIHDTLPEKEEQTCIPRGTQKVWNGDVYKFACSLVTYDDIDFITLPFDHGCTIVWKDEFQKALKKYKPVTNWQEFKKNQAYMNIVAVNNKQDLREFFAEETNVIFNYHQLS